MSAICSLQRRVLTCSSAWRTIRQRERVVLCASVGEGARTETASSSSPRATNPNTETLQTRRWSAAAEATASGPTNNVVQVLRANRGVRLIRNEGRKLVERRFLAFASAVALTTLAWYGQDLISELGKLTSLPVGELDGIIYFIICFNVVSFVLPKSRYNK